jgi:hypothetical protein
LSENLYQRKLEQYLKETELPGVTKKNCLVSAFSNYCNKIYIMQQVAKSKPGRFL